MKISDYISDERLETYKKFTDREERAIALHNQTMQLGSSLMSMIALFELGLRNCTNIQISKKFNDDDWLISNNSSILLHKTERNAIKDAKIYAQKELYKKLTTLDKRNLDLILYSTNIPQNIPHHERVSKRRQQLSVTHGQVIAQTTLFFWKRLFSADYEATLWKTCVKRVFPNKKVTRAEVADALEKVYVIRNRVAHHEPVYGDRLHQVIKALDFLRGNLGEHQKDGSSEFKEFSKMQYLRLRFDYENFNEAWKTLTTRFP